MSFCVHSTGVHKADDDVVVVVVYSNIFLYGGIWAPKNTVPLTGPRPSPANKNPVLIDQKAPTFFKGLIRNKLETKKNIIIHGFGILCNVNKILGTYGKENRETHFG